MKYEKPFVLELPSAVDAIQGSGKNDDPIDSGEPTNAAYEADE
jgi:hypothetical protein